jgi:hypothetical protein
MDVYAWQERFGSEMMIFKVPIEASIGHGPRAGV